MLIYTIYNRPLDYPNHYVVRQFQITSEGAVAGLCSLADCLEEARAMVPPGLACFPRQYGDDSKIVETWL